MPHLGIPLCSQAKGKQESVFPCCVCQELKNRYLGTTGQGTFPAQMAKGPTQGSVLLLGDLMLSPPRLLGDR